jgi:TonB family protein
MHRINFVHQPRSDGDPVRTLRAFIASCAFHGVLLGSVVGLSFYYSSHLPPIKSGSTPGVSVISLETMVITSPPPPKPAPLVPPPPVLPTPATTPPPLPRQLVAVPKLPDEGVPVLAALPNKPLPAPPAKTTVAIHPTISHPITAAVSPAKQRTASALSSYAPGLNELPHPPYPSEARDRGETGVVVMNVQFDDKGDVAQAEVARSSGVPILDSETRSFIRAHWHSAVYAGQTISQPVEYSLENL